MGAAEDKTLVIPNGIDVERFSVPRVEREGFHVGLVGRVVPIKDIKTYIMTAKIVLGLYPEAEFHCIGPTDEDPGYYEDCKLLVESLKIQDRFHFTGRANVLDYYQFLDVMLLTSVREAQPLVILEAYCAGVPVVSTRVGNVAELLDWDERFLANSRDSEKLAEGIVFIHDNPEEMKAINENNRRRVLEKYDKRDLHRRFRELYQKIQGGLEWRA
jgi:glycosyltransferase involved in cell wall biosynthesis